MNDAIFIVTARHGRWSVAYGSKELSSHITKDAAVKHARAYALKDAPSQVIVYDANGVKEFEWNYG